MSRVELNKTHSIVPYRSFNSGNYQNTYLANLVVCRQILKNSGHESGFGVYRTQSEDYISGVVRGNDHTIPDFWRLYSDLDRVDPITRSLLELHTHPDSTYFPSNIDMLIFLHFFPKRIIEFWATAELRKKDLAILFIRHPGERSNLSRMKDYFLIGLPMIHLLDHYQKGRLEEGAFVGCGRNFWHRRGYETYELLVGEDEFEGGRLSLMNANTLEQIYRQIGERTRLSV